MKQCPACKTNYTDETLKFCLADGANLISVPEAEKTIAMSFVNEPMQINVPPDSAPTVFPPAVSNQPTGKGVSPIIVAVLGLSLLLAVIGFVGFIAYIWLKPTDDKNLITTNSSTPITSQKPTPDSDNNELKEKIANLEKQVADQRNQKNKTSTGTFPTPPKSGGTARVNSPGDGFLALRSEPNSETGSRIAKIPHGATVTVLGCPKSSNIGKMSGCWCQVIYNGQTGWAFDAFMIF